MERYRRLARAILVAFMALALALPAFAAKMDPREITNSAESFYRTASNYVIGRDVYQRTGPSTSSAPSGYYRFGEPVAILDQPSDYWFKVQNARGDIFYIYSDYVGSSQDVSARAIDSSKYMFELDKMYDVIEVYRKTILSEEARYDQNQVLGELDHYMGLVLGIASSIRSGNLPSDTSGAMLEVLNGQQSCLEIFQRYIKEPENRDAILEAISDRFFYMEENYQKLGDYR